MVIAQKGFWVEKLGQNSECVIGCLQLFFSNKNLYLSSAYPKWRPDETNLADFKHHFVDRHPLFSCGV
jgi:hypothetical protein